MAVVMQTETAEARAERDMWSLLEVFTRYEAHRNAFYDLNWNQGRAEFSGLT